MSTVEIKGVFPGHKTNYLTKGLLGIQVGDTGGERTFKDHYGYT